MSSMWRLGQCCQHRCPSYAAFCERPIGALEINLRQNRGLWIHSSNLLYCPATLSTRHAVYSAVKQNIFNCQNYWHHFSIILIILRQATRWLILSGDWKIKRGLEVIRGPRWPSFREFSVIDKFTLIQHLPCGKIWSCWLFSSYLVRTAVPD